MIEKNGKKWLIKVKVKEISCETVAGLGVQKGGSTNDLGRNEHET